MPLKLLLADRKLGAASKLAFLQLWEFAGGQPGRVVVTADWLGSTCGRSPKAAWLWLNELEQHDLVKIGERNERRGSVVVDVYNPCPGGRCEAASGTPRQQTLSIGSDEDTSAIDADGTRSVPATQAEVTTPKPPSPLVPKKVQELSYQSTKASKNSMDSMRQTCEAASGTATAGTAAAAAIAAVGSFDPAEQKARLKRRIMAACGATQPVADWVAGSAANLVVYHDVPLQELNQVLVDLDAMRAVGSLQHAGRFFHAKAKQLADRHGKPWPRPR